MLSRALVTMPLPLPDLVTFTENEVGALGPLGAQTIVNEAQGGDRSEPFYLRPRVTGTFHALLAWLPLPEAVDARSPEERRSVLSVVLPAWLPASLPTWPLPAVWREERSERHLLKSSENFWYRSWRQPW